MFISVSLYLCISVWVWVCMVCVCALRACAGAHLYTCTPVHLYTCTPVHLHTPHTHRTHRTHRAHCTRRTHRKLGTHGAHGTRGTHGTHAHTYTCTRACGCMRVRVCKRTRRAPSRAERFRQDPTTSRRSRKLTALGTSKTQAPHLGPLLSDRCIAPSKYKTHVQHWLIDI